MGITYHPRGDSVINVRHFGKFMGTIRRLVGDNGGWRYHANGRANQHGCAFPTLDACKKSLEA